jgi:CheY-like chemotaxis protein
MNLIMNAAQAFINSDERKNTLIIKTILEKDYLRIEFIDNGSGISPEHMKKLFTPFFTTKQSGVGVGLGLSISYAIIHDMGGEIFVNSKLNSGATFTITLPLNIKAPLNPLLKIVPKTIRKLNVLIVDDLPNILKTLRRLLEEQTVTEALGGREALRILSEGSERFDLIIIDINMPDVNGIDLYRYVKHKHPKLTSRIIFLTGSSSEKVKDFLASVDNPYLEKPFSPEELSAAIERLYPFKDKS